MKAIETSDNPVLVHLSGESKDDFFQRIDACGGWPLGMNWVTRRHDDKRTCYFTKEYMRDGWNSSDFHADDYYLWKISEKGLNKIMEAASGLMVERIRNCNWAATIERKHLFNWRGIHG